MDWPDVINGAFECLGAPFIVLSILRLARDKRVAGVSWLHAAFFAAWGYWNLFYYPHLGQWFSFAGAVLIVIANSAWLAQLIWYTRWPGGRR